MLVLFSYRSAAMITTLSSREFNQDTGGAKKAALKGPVFITDRGRPAHVLLSIDDYQRLAGASTGAGIVDQLAMSAADVETTLDFDPPRLNLQPRPADLG